MSGLVGVRWFDILPLRSVITNLSGCSNRQMNENATLNSQVVGNVGLYYVCYRLSGLGWNVMPTARNARGIDVVIYSQDARRTFTLQVKSLSKRSPVPLGNHLRNLFGDFFVICRKVTGEKPECFVLRPAEVRTLAHRGEKNGKVSFWLQPREYENDKFVEGWGRIGKGTAVGQRTERARKSRSSAPAA